MCSVMRLVAEYTRDTLCLVGGRGLLNWGLSGPSVGQVGSVLCLAARVTLETRPVDLPDLAVLASQQLVHL